MSTFKAPVITQDSDVTTQRQGAADGSIEVIRTRTSDGQLISKTLVYGQSDGAIVTQRIFADNSWTKTEVKGQADGTILRTITEGYEETQ